MSESDTEQEWFERVHHREASNTCWWCRHYEDRCGGAGYCKHPDAASLGKDLFLHTLVTDTCDLFAAR